MSVVLKEKVGNNMNTSLSNINPPSNIFVTNTTNNIGWNVPNQRSPLQIFIDEIKIRYNLENETEVYVWIFEKLVLIDNMEKGAIAEFDKMTNAK